MRKLNSQDFALLSDHVYGREGKHGKVELVFDNPSNKEITLNGITYKVEEIKKNPQNGYFGAVYRRLDTNEIIVAHRGTEFGTRQDREADMRMVRDRTNPQYQDAKALTEAAEKWKKSQSPNSPIYQTGHSLGGSLAQLCGHRYGHYTETFNAFGTAGLKEAQPLNPMALANIINHRMGGDYVASAANHLGRSVLYTTPREVSNLRKGGFATHDTKDDNFYANAYGMPERWNKPLSAFDLYTSHSMSNFTHVGGLSVLAPNSNARQLAQENMAVLERFNNHVKEEIRKAPGQFEKLFDWADRWVAENDVRLNPYGEQTGLQFADNGIAGYGLEKREQPGAGNYRPDYDNPDWNSLTGSNLYQAILSADSSQLDRLGKSFAQSEEGQRMTQLGDRLWEDFKEQQELERQQELAQASRAMVRTL